jgi:eukaryotic-like serine/threonine-protein kinase
MPATPVVKKQTIPVPPGSPGHPGAAGQTPSAGLGANGQGKAPARPGSGAGVSPGAPPVVRFPVEGEALASQRGTYTLGRVVGRGQYGAVYEARGPFDQRFAIKMLVPAQRPYAEVQAEWVRESQRLLLLRHPGVVYMHDAFEAQSLFYLALEWCPHTLKDLLAQGPLHSRLAVEVIRQVLAAVQYLHDNDIIHSDLHAGNVLLTRLDPPIVKLADFGIAQELGHSGVAIPNVVHHAIMAPEVVSAGYTSRQSDIYQVGLLLYLMVTGRSALDFGLPYPELVKQVSVGVARERAEKLNSPLGNVIAKMLRRREAYRYGSAHEVWDDLRQVD